MNNIVRGSRIPIIIRSHHVRTPITSPERNAETTLSSVSKPSISEGKNDRRAGSPDGKQEAQTKRDAKTTLSSFSKPSIPEGKKDRQAGSPDGKQEPLTKRNDRTNRCPRSQSAIPERKQNCKAERIVSTKLGSQSKPGISYGKQDRKSELEPCAKRTFIKLNSSTASPLPSPKPAPAPGPTALRTKLNDEAVELLKKLLDRENIVSEQAQLKASQRAKDEIIAQLKSELLAVKADNDHMVSRLEETNLGLERATSKANKQAERFKFLECELAVAQNTITSDVNKIRELQEKLELANAEVEIHCKAETQLREEVDRMHVKLEGHQQELVMHSDMVQSMQKSEQDLRVDLEKRDKLINQVSAELAVRDEDFKNLFSTLEYTHSKLRIQEDSTKLLEQRNRRLEERNAALKEKIVQLKLTLRDYAHIIIGNNGKPFFEVISTPRSQDTARELGPSQK